MKIINLDKMWTQQLDIRQTVADVGGGRFIASIMFGEFKTKEEADCVLQYMIKLLKNALPEEGKLQ